jgi:hypothetical protein
MFVIGMELDLKVLRNKAQDAIVVSHASIVFPFTLGMGLAYFVYSSFAPPNVQFLSFGLFLGIAMSITAFPVLARICQWVGLDFWYEEFTDVGWVDCPIPTFYSDFEFCERCYSGQRF